MTTRDEYREKMEQQLQQWSAWIDQLKGRADKAGEETKKALLEERQELEKLQALGKEHLAKLEKTATSVWDDVKAELAEQWNRLSGAADAIWARFRSTAQ